MITAKGIAEISKAFAAEIIFGSGPVNSDTVSSGSVSSRRNTAHEPDTANMHTSETCPQRVEIPDAPNLEATTKLPYRNNNESINPTGHNKNR